MTFLLDKYFNNVKEIGEKKNENPIQIRLPSTFKLVPGDNKKKKACHLM